MFIVLRKNHYAAVIVPVGCFRRECEHCSNGARPNCDLDGCAVEFVGLQGIHSKQAYLPKRCLLLIGKKLENEELLRLPFYDHLSTVVSVVDRGLKGFSARFDYLKDPKKIW